MPQPTSSGTITLIHKSRKTILDYLKNQGFNTADYEDFGVNEIHAMLSNDKLDMLMSSVNGGANERKVYVKYHLGKTLRSENIEVYIEDLFNIERVLTKNDMLIIIIKQEPNQTLINLLNQLQNLIQVELFQYHGKICFIYGNYLLMKKIFQMFFLIMH